MNEVEGMDLSERSRLHSPPSACLVSDELNSNVSENGSTTTSERSSCAIPKTNCNQGALILLETSDIDNCVVNDSNKSDAKKDDDDVNKGELSRELLSKDTKSEVSGCETKDVSNFDSSEDWRIDIQPAQIIKELDENYSKYNNSNNPLSSTECCNDLPESQVLNENGGGDDTQSSLYFKYKENDESECKKSSAKSVEISENSNNSKLCTFTEKETEEAKDNSLDLPNDGQSENYKLGPTFTENSENEVEKSDGSDSGLGSELADEKLESSVIQEGGDSDSKTSEIDSVIGCDTEISHEEQVSTEMDPSERCDGSDSGLGLELSDERVEPFQLETENDSKITVSLLPDPGSCLEVDEDKSDFHIEAPALDDLKSSTFEEIRSHCLSFEEIKDNSEPLETPQPNLDFPVYSLCEKPEESKTIEQEILKPLPENQIPLRSSLKRKSDTDLDIIPKKKRSISFDTVSVYYFPRAQGFTCVPSQGGSTLGMSPIHSHVQQFTLSEHATEQRRLHRLMLQRLRNERLQPPSDTDDTESDEEPTDEDEGEMDLDSYYFLQVTNLFIVVISTFTVTRLQN